MNSDDALLNNKYNIFFNIINFMQFVFNYKIPT